MLKTKTILWVGIPLLLLFAFAWAYHLYVKPHQSAAGESADFTIDADSLYQQYQTNEHLADQKYLGKVIEVSGKLSEIQRSGISFCAGIGTRHKADQELCDGGSDRKARGSSSHAEQAAFDQQLRDNPATFCAERVAH